MSANVITNILHLKKRELIKGFVYLYFWQLRKQLSSKNFCNYTNYWSIQRIYTRAALKLYLYIKGFTKRGCIRIFTICAFSHYLCFFLD